MIFIFNQAGEVIADTSGSICFKSHNSALEYMRDNTGMLENGDKFIIVDFDNDCSHFYFARLSLVIDAI